MRLRLDDNAPDFTPVCTTGPGYSAKIKLALTYPTSSGRSLDEPLRVIDSLQPTAMHQVATPLNRLAGGDVRVVPAVPDENARKKLPGGLAAAVRRHAPRLLPAVRNAPRAAPA